MKSTALSCLAALLYAQAAHAAPAPALESTDVTAVVDQLRKDAAAQKVSFKPAAVTGIWVDQDCEKFVFEENSPARSDARQLMSRTWLEECRQIPTPPAGGICVPEPRRLISWDEKTVSIELKGRSTPSPKEVFEVCLWGRQLSLKVKSSPYKYSVSETDGAYILTRK